jgi:hypothetical protein
LKEIFSFSLDFFTLMQIKLTSARVDILCNFLDKRFLSNGFINVI